MDSRHIDPFSLDLVMKDDQFVIYYYDKPLLTAKGNSFSHPAERLLQNIITDLQVKGPVHGAGISLFHLFEFCRDFIDQGTDPIADIIEKIIRDDPFVLMKTGKGKNMLPGGGTLHFDSESSSDHIMQTVFWTASMILKSLNSFLAENIQSLEMTEEMEHPFLNLLKQEYNRMIPAEKTVVNMLSGRHCSGIVLPFLFAYGKITASEYAKGCVALDPKAIGGYDKILQEAIIAGEYLEFPSGRSGSEPSLLQMIKKGESGDLEFKSTFRWDLRANKTNPSVERASLKSICAFLNSSGGTLMIGVRDDGTIEGIESDRFVNDDKFLLHLWTLIRTSLGRDVSPYIRCRLEKSDEKTVCILSCIRAPRPVFLRQPGFDEEFYIRLGPSSAALDISEALKYIGERFKEDRG